MRLPVGQGDPKVDHRVAGKAALGDLGPNALLNAGNELTGNGPADHLVDELEAGPTFERFDGDVTDGVLTVPTALFDVASVTIGGTDEGLAQRHS